MGITISFHGWKSKDYTNYIDERLVYDPSLLGNKEQVRGFYKVNAARKSKVDDNTARMQSIKQLGV